MSTTRAPFACGGNGSSTHRLCIGAQGFDETFSRMWQFYLAYSEAGFRSGYLGVSQLQLMRASA